MVCEVLTGGVGDFHIAPFQFGFGSTNSPTLTHHLYFEKLLLVHISSCMEQSHRPHPLNLTSSFTQKVELSPADVIIELLGTNIWALGRLK